MNQFEILSRCDSQSSHFNPIVTPTPSDTRMSRKREWEEHTQQKYYKRSCCCCCFFQFSRAYHSGINYTFMHNIFRNLHNIFIGSMWYTWQIALRCAMFVICVWRPFHTKMNPSDFLSIEEKKKRRDFGNELKLNLRRLKM